MSQPKSRSNRTLVLAVVLAASLPLLTWRSYVWGYRCGAVLPFETGLHARLVSENLVEAQARHGSPEELREALLQRLLTLDLVQALPDMANLKRDMDQERLWALLLLWQTELALAQNGRAQAHLEQAKELCGGGLEKDCSEAALTRTARAVRELLLQRASR